MNIPSVLPPIQLPIKEELKVYDHALNILFVLQIVYCIIDLLLYLIVPNYSNLLWPLLCILAVIVGWCSVRNVEQISVSLLGTYCLINAFAAALFLSFLLASFLTGNYVSTIVTTIEIIILLASINVTWILIKGFYAEVAPIVPMNFGASNNSTMESRANANSSQRLSMINVNDSMSQGWAPNNANGNGATHTVSSVADSGFRLFSGQGRALRS